MGFSVQGFVWSYVYVFPRSRYGGCRGFSFRGFGFRIYNVLSMVVAEP